MLLLGDKGDDDDDDDDDDVRVSTAGPSSKAASVFSSFAGLYC